MAGVVKLLRRPGSQHFTDKIIEMRPGQTVKLGRCTWWRYEVFTTGLFCDPVVSRKHAEIEFKGNSFTIMDEGSLNGTLLNNQRLSPVRTKSTKFGLTCGDLVTLGCGMTDHTGKKVLPIICLVELTPCTCMDHDTLVPSSLPMDEAQEVDANSGDAEEESQSLLKDYVSSLY